MGKANWNVSELRRSYSLSIRAREQQARGPSQPRCSRRWLAAYRWVVRLGAWSVACAVAPALAQDDDSTRAVARQLGAQGIEAYQSEEYGVAETKLDRAYKLFPTPTLALWSARARVKMGHWVEASERYREATRGSAQVGDVAAQKQAKIEATRELEELLPRIPSLVIQLEGAEPSQVTLQLDAAPVSMDLLGLPRPTNPGAHVLTATRTRDQQRQQRSVRLLEREQETVLFMFGATAAAAAQPAISQTTNAARDTDTGIAAEPQQDLAHPRDQGGAAGVYKAIAIPALVLGGLGLVTAGVSALVAVNACPEADDCDKEDLPRYNTMTTLSTVTFYAGSALLVGGAITWLLAPSDKREPSAALRWGVGPGGVSVSGAF